MTSTMVAMSMKCLHFATHNGVPSIFRRMVLGTGVPDLDSRNHGDSITQNWKWDMA